MTGRGTLFQGSGGGGFLWKRCLAATWFCIHRRTFHYYGEGVFEVVDADVFVVVMEAEGRRAVRHADNNGFTPPLRFDGQGNRQGTAEPAEAQI